MSTMQPPWLPGHRFIDKIDTAGFAEVFLYHDERMDRDVAVKVRSGQVEGRSFIDEAKIVAKVSSHPNIVTIFDQGATSASQPYLIMEYCPPPNMRSGLSGQSCGSSWYWTLGLRLQEPSKPHILQAFFIETSSRPIS
jgi:eukaryotic-like serine/threonine-protein kinase